MEDIAIVCPYSDIDSGGFDPQGHPISVGMECPNVCDCDVCRVYQRRKPMNSLMVSGTPWAVYVAEDDTDPRYGWPVYVKREDLCCNPPGPQYSKMRGLEMYLNKLPKGTSVGVQDAGYHSRSGWGTAYLCQGLDLQCYDFYPVYKRELIDPDGGFVLGNHELREFQRKAKDLGAILVPQRAGRAKMLWYQARKCMKDPIIDGIMLPAGLKLKESAEGTAIEVRDHTPEELCAGTWLISISSGTVASGVLLGLKDYDNIQFIAHMGSSKKEAPVRAHMCALAGYDPGERLAFVDEGYGYSDPLENYPVPFPCSVHYEAKMWKWMLEHIEELEPPVIFWNIGS